MVTKILHIISGDIWAGAASQVFETLLYQESNSDLEAQCLLFNKGELYEKNIRANIDTIVIDENKNKLPSLIYKTSNFLKCYKPDIIHVHNVKEHMVAKFAKFMIKNCFLIRTTHGRTAIWDNEKLMKRMRGALVVFADKLLKKYFTDGIIAVSKDLENELKKIRCRGNVYQVYNSFNVRRLKNDKINFKKDIRKEYSADHKFWIGTTSRLVGVKNIKMLIEAGNILKVKRKNFIISIFGQGPMFDELNKEIISKNISNYVQLKGFVKNIYEVISQLDLFVLCSNSEGIPMSILESLSLKTPVISTKVGGVKEIIINNENGLLVKKNDANDLAEKINIIIENKNIRNKLRKNGVKTVREKFNYEKCNEKIILFYKNIFSEKCI